MATTYIKDKYAIAVAKNSNESLVEYANEAVRQRIEKDGFKIEVKQ